MAMHRGIDDSAQRVEEAAGKSGRLLELRNLHSVFQGRKETVFAVNGVSFDVYDGETFGLVGESGCGKSQTLRSILRLLKAPGRISEGEILYRSRDLVKMKEKEMRQIRGREIGVIFQEPMTALNPVLRIRTQIYEALGDFHLSKEGKEARAVELLQMVGIPSARERLDEYPHQFSGGMRQRAMIAIALGRRPSLLLADEPTTALDVTIQDQIMKLLLRLKKELKMSMILVTHDMGVIAQTCDRVAVMYAGEIVELAPVGELFRAPRHPYTLALLNALPDGKDRDRDLETIPGTPPDLRVRSAACAFAPRCRYATDVCGRQKPSPRPCGEGHVSACLRREQIAAFETSPGRPQSAGAETGVLSPHKEARP